MPAESDLSLVISLDGGNEDGAFLVRESNTAVGDYVLSVLHEGEVVHYQIRRHGEDAFFSIGMFDFVIFYKVRNNFLTLMKITQFVTHRNALRIKTYVTVS
jgi:hypothetical protein